MYALVLATLFTTGNEVPDFGRRGGCRGGGWGCFSSCYGGCYGGWGGCYGGRGGCYGGCGGCYGCYGSYSCYGGCFGCGGGYAACYGGCFGCGGCGGMVISSGCCGGGMTIASGGCVGGSGAGALGSPGGSASGSGGQAGSGGVVSNEATQTLQELKKSLADLKKEQERLRTEALKQVAEELRLKATDQKIDELRRAIEELKRRPLKGPIPLPMPVPGQKAPPGAPQPEPEPGKVRLELPPGSLVVVNGKPIAKTPVFLTPPIQPGEEYVGTFEVTATRSGKSITRVKRLTVGPGTEVRLAFEDMEPTETQWTKAEAAHITVRLPADARLIVDGVECPLTSATRTFDTPSLALGREYSYVLKVEVARGGRRIAQTKRVAFRAGESVEVSFDNTQAESLAAR